ncbi:protein-disulfide reductase DsbD [Celerinatantimonas yamalensis]|uniref:Protein-disulfide reductase DsbD n=1 Tax=Celerinatantimonas yamalensis TaxID=559956 RepID=A0ABW9G880_9GAMM
MSKQKIKAMMSWVLKLRVTWRFALFGLIVACSIAYGAVLPENQAISLSANYQNGQLNLHWQMAPGVYLYRDKIQLQTDSSTPLPIYKPPGQAHHDPIFGDTRVYAGSVNVMVDIPSSHLPLQLRVSYQGCAKSGICYPPMLQRIELSEHGVKLTTGSNSIFVPDNSVSSSPLKMLPPATPARTDLPDWLEQSTWLTLAMSFGFGLLLAFTPCVLPMLPLITGLILGSGQRSWRQTLLLSVSYVQGMALTYTLLGILVAWLGLQLQVWLQSPWLLSVISGLLVILAVSMFGWFELQLPSFLQVKLMHWQRHLDTRSYGRVLLMGAISGVICSPCVTAPTAGVLLYIAQTGNLWLGGGALYLFALGMGLPLIAITLLGRQVLPKVGAWMIQVRVVGGFLLLATALLLLERIIPEPWSTGIWLIWAGWVLWWLSTQILSRCWPRFKFLRFIIAPLLCVVMAVILWRPWLGGPSVAKALSMTSVTSLTALKEQLAKAKQAQRPVLVDYYADWCVACRELSQQTLSDPQVRDLLANFQVIRVDLSTYSDAQQALLSHYQVLGLPTLDFFSAAGKWRPNARISGFISAAQLTPKLAASQNQGRVP